MAESTKTEVGSYFISNYPPFSQWKAENLDAVETALAADPLVGNAVGFVSAHPVLP